MTEMDDQLERFEIARRRCVDQYRAFGSLQAAQEYAFKLLETWDSNDKIISSALHSAIVTAYSRPFSHNKTSKGNREYPVSDLKNVSPGFDTEMHQHLLMLRNQMIAHSDYTWLKSTMFCQAVGDEGVLPVELGINVKRIRGLENRELAERYFTHISSCVVRVSSIFNKEFDDLARKVRDNPKLFNSTANMPTAISPGLVAGSLNSLPPPTGPAGDVKEPDFKDKIAGYRFEKLTHKRALIKSGTYTVRVNGALQEFSFYIDGPEI